MEKKEKNHPWFTHRDCPHYPCHDLEALNCLFCFCPLYPLGRDCGGAFKVLAGGVKDCSGCLFPHRAENYDEVIRRVGEVLRRFPCQEATV